MASVLVFHSIYMQRPVSVIIIEACQVATCKRGMARRYDRPTLKCHEGQSYNVVHGVPT